MIRRSGGSVPRLPCIAGLLVALLGAGCATTTPRFAAHRGPAVGPEEMAAEGHLIRVAVLSGVNDLAITSNVSFDLIVGKRGTTDRPGSIWRLRLVGGEPALESRRGHRVKDVAFPIRLVPKGRGGLVIVNGNRYRGSLQIRRRRDGSYLAINVVGLEDYLRGVVPKEIGALGEEQIEAAKAQAVAARSYAVSHIGRYAQEGYDLQADERDQVYGGVMAEWPVTDRAVSATRGMVLVNEGSVIEAVYHSTCGGRTADARELWGRKNVPYLRGTYDTEDHRRGGRAFCRDSPRFEWECQWPQGAFHSHVASNLGEVLCTSQYAIGQVRAVRIKHRTSSGRVRTLEVITSHGRYELDAAQARQVLTDERSGRTVYSPCFGLTRRGSHVIIRGKGWGHGAGMCQWGAKGMAQAGYSFEKILEHYYRGTALARLPD